MAVAVKDATDATVTIKSTLRGSDQVYHHLEEPGTTLLAGEKDDVGTTPAPLVGSATPCRIVEVAADPDNSEDVFVGNDTAQPRKLKPGNAQAIGIDDVAKVYVATASGTATVSWLAVL